MPGNLGSQEARRGRVQGWLQTAVFLGAAAVLAMVVYTSFVVQSNRRAQEAAATAAVQTQTALIVRPQPVATVPETPKTENWEPYANTPLPAALRPLWADNADRIAELARWGRGVVNGVAWAPDGSFLAVGTSIGVYLYDPQTLEAITLLDVGDSVGPLAFSPDSQLLVLALSKDRAQLWNVVEGTLLQIVEGVGSKIAVGFSPAGQPLLAWMSPGGAAPVLWRDGVAVRLPLPLETTLAPLENPPARQVGAGEPAAVALSPDGRFVAVGLTEGIVYLWRVADGGLLATLAAGEDLDGLAFSPSGRLLATASALTGVQVWQTDGGTRLYTLERGIAGPANLAFSPDGRRLAVAGPNIVRLYGMDTGALVRWVEFSRAAGGISPLPFGGARAAFSPDGQRLVLATVAEQLLFFDVEDGALAQSRPGFAPPWCGLALSPDGATLAVRTLGDDAIWLWDVARAVPLRELPAPAGCGLGAGTFSPDSRLLAASGGPMVSFWRMDGTIAAQLGPHPGALPPSALPEDPVHCAIFSPDGRWVAAISSQGKVQLWQWPVGALRWTAPLTSTATSGLCELAFSPGGQYLATAGLGTPVSLWAIPAGSLVHRWDISPDDARGGLAFSPDGRLLAAWTAPGEVSLWQVADGETRRTLAAPTEAGLTLAFSPDGSLLAGGSLEGPIYLWRVGDGTLLRSLEGHTAWVSGLAFSTDERLLFSASADGTVRVWGAR